ncbi:hypothetical protein [Amycolatopsis circi]|uniref:hypothetical protein n=1 Tax=Amycolatopsis circi TaxID=871959 RepID=UPI000E2659D0|nr:hypothetical protein [Amycolatopsis circi]
MGMDTGLAAGWADEDFVRDILVRFAAPNSERWIAAYSCETPEQRRAFIDTGILEAAAKDKVNDMKARAAAVVGVDAGQPGPGGRSPGGQVLTRECLCRF